MSKDPAGWHTTYANTDSSPWTPQSWREYCEDGAGVDAQRRYRLNREPYLALKYLRPAAGDRILEAGCGYGRISAHLLAAGATLVGCDISPPMIEFCKARFQGGCFWAANTDISRLPFRKNSFDKVLCSGVLMHVDNYETTLTELTRVLRVGGQLVVSVNSRFSPFIRLNSLQRRLLKRTRQLTYRSSRVDAIKTGAHSPQAVAQLLKKLHLEITGLEADTLFCADYRIPKLGLPVLPTFALPLYKFLDDRLCDKLPFAFLGWELWYSVRKTS